MDLLLKIPGVQKELVQLKRWRPLTPAVWERVKQFVRGDLDPETCSSTGGVRHLPELSEVASRLEAAIEDDR
jgi:hypothetical protein